MNKKLKKYIESYDTIQNYKTYDLVANGGMTLLVNKGTSCEIFIEDNSYTFIENQSVLINAYEKNLAIESKERIYLLAVRFKGAGASFFYEEEMEELMYNPKRPIILKENILENELDKYFLDRLKVSTLPFNIMKIVDLLDEQGSNYNIDEVLAIANVPRKILDKAFRLKAGLSFKTYATIKELNK